MVADVGQRTDEQAVSVLVVDDEPSIRDFLGFMLADEGFRVETAVDGLDALRLAALHPPTVVLTDLSMPRLDGASLIRRLREARLPIRGIIAMSAYNAAGTPPPGADLFIAKPFEVERVVAGIEALLDGDHR